MRDRLRCAAMWKDSSRLTKRRPVYRNFGDARRRADSGRRNNPREIQITDWPLSHHLAAGRGGMGEVYLAEDTRLARRIALKILPFLHANNDRVRVLKPSRAASALNHPNIITIYDIGQTEDSVHYIAAEYVDGEILRTRLQQGPVAPLLAVEVAMQIAEALAAAHEADYASRHQA